MLKRLEFASSDVYAPQGRQAISDRSKRRVTALKGGKDFAIGHYSRRAMQLASEAEFPGFFGTQVTLVPVCRSWIVLIDDVVTRGTTLLAAASRIAEVYPDAEVRAYACVRTLSAQEIDDMEVPCVGWIEPAGKWAHREP